MRIKGEPIAARKPPFEPDARKWILLLAALAACLPFCALWTAEDRAAAPLRQRVPCGLSLALRLYRVRRLLRGLLLGELSEALIR